MRAEIARHGLLASGDAVVVAWSGGADSTALVHALLSLSGDLGISVRAVHVNHGLHAEAAAHEQHVRLAADQLGVELRVVHVDLASEAREAGESLEQAGRRIRLQCFRRLVTEGWAAKVATGHTADDQAETVLLRILRGSGPRGLAGIRPVLESGVVRPMLRVRRSEILEFLAERGIEYVEDPTNRSSDFDRNRLRHKLLPELESAWNPKLTERLASLARHSLGDEEYWAATIPRIAEQCLVTSPESVQIDCARWSAEPSAVRHRLLRFAVEEIRGNSDGWDAAHFERLTSLMDQPEGRSRLTLPGLTAERSFKTVRLSPPASNPEPAPPRAVRAIDAPGRYVFAGATVELALNSSGAPADREYNDRLGEAVDWDRTPKPLLLRSWNPGDQYRPRGDTRPRKLKELFQKARILAWQRADWPVLVGGTDAAGSGDTPTQSPGVLVWARQFGVAEEFAARRQSRRLMRIRYLGGNADESKSPPARLQTLGTHRSDAPAGRGAEDDQS